VVPTFRRPGALRATLEALLQQQYPADRYEVVVVDDDRSQSTAVIVRSLLGRGADLRLDAQDRRGAAAARNRGARLAVGDVVIFLDDDVVVESDHLMRHRAARDRFPDAMVGGVWEFAPTALATLQATPFGRYRLELERSFQSQTPGRSLGEGRHAVNVLASTNLAIRRELFWQLGGFDEAFPVAGAEDQDFSMRARAAGCLMLLDTNIRCLHNDDRLTLRDYCEREERSAKTMPFLARNHPSEFARSPYLRENRPIQRGDEAPLVAKKLLKAALSHRPVLAVLHGLVEKAEVARAPEAHLRRLYRLLFGLYLFRGVRSTWDQAARAPNACGTAPIGTIKS
jgi:GT2 family glycosyltransferase